MRTYISLLLSLTVHILQAQSPVQVGIWEKFDKYSLPAQSVYVNNRELKNGRDDDADGYIDNINGIGFDAREQRTAEYFYCTTATAPDYAHGTAVASVLLRHNRAIELHGVGFVPTSQRMRESGMSAMSVQERQAQLPAEYARMKAFVDQSLAYFAIMQCRVVNISWGLSLQHFLANNPNLGGRKAERKAKAREWLQQFKTCLTDGFSRYPSILFVVAVGNNGTNIDRALDVPGSIHLQNVILVGALDKAQRKRAAYSNHGKDVVYAAGTDIAVTESLNRPDTESGTSLAAPVATALIARLWSGNPHLSETITLQLVRQQLLLYRRWENNVPENNPGSWQTDR